MLQSAPSHQLADIISALVNASYNEKVEVLNSVDLRDRFLKALPLLTRQIEGLKMLQEKQEMNVRNEGKKRNPINGAIKALTNKKSADLDDDIDELQDLEALTLRNKIILELRQYKNDSID